MSHPSYEVPKTYLAEVEGLVDNKIIRLLRRGVQLDDGPVHPDTVTLVSGTPTRSLVRITLHEGRNRVVRRIFDHIGHPVRRLSRIAIGPVRVGTLKAGQTRDLTPGELGQLLDLVGL
jgi:23S rRNA pseudouridine2605 synthase